jgi:hypothetical protein
MDNRAYGISVVILFTQFISKTRAETGYQKSRQFNVTTKTKNVYALASSPPGGGGGAAGELAHTWLFGL